MHSYITKNFNEFEFFDYLTSCLCIIVITVNFLVVLSSGFLLQRGQQPRATYVYLGNISLSDMIVGVINLFLILYPHQLYGELLCSLSISFTAAMVSAFSIGLVAIDRFLYILYGLHYNRYFTTQHSHLVVSLIWVFSGGITFGLIFCFRRPMDDGICWLITIVPQKIAVLLVSAGAIPLVLIFVLYSIILKNALNSMSRMKCTASVCNLETHARDLRMFRGKVQMTSNSENDDLPDIRVRSFGLPCCRSSTFTITPTFCKNKWKAVKIVVFTTGAFLITWLPCIVTWILFAFCDLNMPVSGYCANLEFTLNTIMTMLITCNSLLNPLIYAWWHPGFRNSVKRMYSMLLGKVFENHSMGSSPPEPKIQHKSFSLKQNGQENFDSEKEIRE